LWGIFLIDVISQGIAQPGHLHPGWLGLDKIKKQNKNKKNKKQKII
jgi:hypothetical protein